MKSPRSTVDLRQANSQILLRQLYFNGPMSRLELSRRTNLSPSTVTNVTGEILQDGLMIETGEEESTGGRPRTILDINPVYGYLIGVDLGETHVQMELFDLTRHKLGTIRNTIRTDSPPIEQYLQVIAEGYASLVTNAGIPCNKILGMGIGVPGIVGHDSTVSVAAPMWGWESVKLLDLLERRIELPVYIDNGAKAMALAEAWFGAGRGVQDMAVILIGTGIGAGIITKGNLYRGATNSAGEWGHTKITLDGRACRCGSHGCLEAYAGAPGIITTFRETDKLSFPMTLEDETDILNDIIQKYQANDPRARQVLHDITRLLGAGIANLVNLFNPELIVIGGWAGLMIGEVVMDDLKRYVKEYSLPHSTLNLQIDLCMLGEDAICTGAACLVLDEFMSSNQKFNRLANTAIFA